MENATSAFRSLLSDYTFLAPTNLTRAPPPQVDYQGTSMDLDLFCMNLYEFIWFPGLWNGQVRIILLLTLFLASSSKVLPVWFDPFLLVDEADLWLLSDWFNFLLGYVPSHSSWNIYLEVSSCCHNSARFLGLLVANSSLCTNSCLCHFQVTENSTSLIITSSGNTWSIPNGEKCLRYSTILFTRQMKSHTLYYWG